MTYQANGKDMSRKEMTKALGEEAFMGLLGAAKKMRAATGKKAFTFWKEGSLLTIRF